MIKILPTILFTTISLHSFSQAGEWTWMHGNSGNNPPGSFGTQGVAAANNKPPGLYEAVSWTDNDHNFWLFGGVNGGIYGDLWKYDVATNFWTWINGNAGLNTPGSYGTQGVSSPTNHPGARGYGTIGWVDSSGNLWMFAGWGYDAFGTYGPLSDVWLYNISTNEWTWIKGSNSSYQLANYGTILVASATNDPGNRYETNAGWTDEEDNLWIFGGESQQGFTINLNDVWKYEPATNDWTWMQGTTASAGYQAAVYGTQGVPDPSNTPGSRSAYCVSKDADGKFWMFGGYYMFPNPAYNDLWMFDPVTLEWTWMGGSTFQNDNGNYVGLCDTNSQLPSARYENRSNWTDDCGNLWTFGGVSNNIGGLTDLWIYSVSTGKWIWASGSNAGNMFPVYGTQGISNAANMPGGRSGSVTWTDSSGNLWLFGGFDFNFNTKNDLWRFQIDPTCTGEYICSQFPVSAIASSDTSLCEKFCIDFFDQSLNSPTSWQWLFPGGVPSSSTDQNPTQICYQTPGVYDVTLITTNSFGTDTTTFINYITVNPTPPFPTITQNGYTLTSSPATTYQWQFNSVDIPGATNQSYDVQQTGYYSVIISDQNGCITSGTIYVLIEGINDISSDTSVIIYPNPSNGNFVVEFLKGFTMNESTIEVYNALGQTVFSSVESGMPGKDFKIKIDLDNVSPGVYFVGIRTKSIFSIKKLIVSNSQK